MYGLYTNFFSKLFDGIVEQSRTLIHLSRNTKNIRCEEEVWQKSHLNKYGSKFY